MLCELKNQPCGPAGRIPTRREALGTADRFRFPRVVFQFLAAAYENRQKFVPLYDATTPSDPPEPSGTPAYRTAGSYTLPEVCGRFVAASASRGRTAATAGAGVLTDMMQFTLRHTDTRTEARAGELATDHGVIRTPIFMPVGTAAAVKGIFHRDVRDEAGAEIILANTYHLYLRPGTKILEEAACTASRRGRDRC